MSIDLQQLPGVLPGDRPDFWHVHSLSRGWGKRVETGHSGLDAALGGGWPVPGLVELLGGGQSEGQSEGQNEGQSEGNGIGELSLLLPLIRQAASQKALILWVNPPHALYAPALARQGIDPMQQWLCANLDGIETAWVLEQGLKSGVCGLVLAWWARATPAMLRRCKLAVVAGQTLGIVFRPLSAAAQPSPASVRIRLQPRAQGLTLDILKAQGRRPGVLEIDLSGRAMP
jgi:hypothetical protein